MFCLFKSKQVIPAQSKTTDMYQIAQNARAEHTIKIDDPHSVEQHFATLLEKVKNIVLAETFEDELVNTAKNGEERHFLCDELVSLNAFDVSNPSKNYELMTIDLAIALENMLQKNPDISTILNKEGRKVDVSPRYDIIKKHDKNNKPISENACRYSVSVIFIPTASPQEKKKRCNIL